MGRCLVCLTGPVLAGLFALAMYGLYGNINWGSAAFRANAWIEAVFWTLAASGVVALLLRDACKGIGGFCARLRRPRSTTH